MKPPLSRAAWFAIGWFSLDVYDGLDIEPLKYQRCILNQIKSPSPIIGVAKAICAPNFGIGSQATAPNIGSVKAKTDRPPTPNIGEYIYLPSKQPIISQHYMSEEARYDH